MATDQEMTIVDVIHAALDRLPVSMAITILSGIYAETCAENGVGKERAVGFLERRYEEYGEMIKSDKKEN
jgi:hypothetical protein